MFFFITDVEYYFLMFYKIKYCLQIWDVVNLVLYLQRTSRQGTPTERGIPVNSSMAKGDEENGMGWHSRNNKRVQGQNGNGNGRKSWSLRPSLSPHMQMLARYECFSRERERDQWEKEAPAPANPYAFTPHQKNTHLLSSNPLFLISLCNSHGGFFYVPTTTISALLSCDFWL